MRPYQRFVQAFCMARMKRTITIKETATLLTLKLKSKEIRRGWCSECEAEVFWLELVTAMELFGMIELSKESDVHLKDGRVCSRSLLNNAEVGNEK